MAVANTTNSYDPWHFLRYGDAEKGLDLIRDAYIRKATPSHIMELGIAYLWVKDYASAHSHFNNSIRLFPQSASVFYGMAGVAQWCLGRNAAAVATWQDGLKSRYADTSGLGISLPLLLFVAGVLNPKVFIKQNAEEILLRKILDPRASRWPGTLAQFVVGQVTPKEALALESTTKELDKRHRKWMVQFYSELLSFADQKLTSRQFVGLMQTITDTVQPAFLDHDFFLSVIWSGEFFIARSISSDLHAEC